MCLPNSQIKDFHACSRLDYPPTTYLAALLQTICRQLKRYQCAPMPFPCNLGQLVSSTFGCLIPGFSTRNKQKLCSRENLFEQTLVYYSMLTYSYALSSSCLPHKVLACRKQKPLNDDFGSRLGDMKRTFAVNEEIHHAHGSKRALLI